MIHWLRSITLGVSKPQEASPQPSSEKIMVQVKALPIAKMTLVQIAADDTRLDHIENEKPMSTAASALAIELAKQPLWATQQSPRLLSMSSSVSASIRSSEYSWKDSRHSLLASTLRRRSLETRLSYQRKSSAASISVSISASGSTVAVADDNLPETRPASIADGDSCRSGISSAAARLLQQHIATHPLMLVTDVPAPSNILSTSPTSIHSISDSNADRRHSLESGHATTSLSTKHPATPTTSPARNMVLPTFHSEFRKPEQVTVPSAPTTMSSLLESAMETLATMCMSREERLARSAPAVSTFDSLAKLKHFFRDLGNGVEKRIVVVGIHGWFPTKLVRSVIGEPTGTSKRFCKQMVLAIRRYMAEEHSMELADHAITVIPLEYEGKVEERVCQLYRQLVDNIYWLEAISSADAILWGTHSQGTPVTTMLLQRLLEQGLIHTRRQSICMLAMAGIAQGPFPYLKGSLIVKYFEADAARELFEFMDSESAVCVNFRSALTCILRHGVKTVLVGSMQDQVVPLYSAVMSSVSHPGILRAVYIDRHIYAKDDFIINLVVFALQLRNAGLCDHGLLENISQVLAGSIYALEGGHSTIYEEVDVYMHAVRCLFETAPIGELQKVHQTHPGQSPAIYPIDQAPILERFQAKTQINPFHLPWALRGIFDDPVIATHPVFHAELVRLQALFVAWKPKDARMREIKFRLEPLEHHILTAHS